MSAEDPTPEPVAGVRKSAAVHIHEVDDPDAWRHAVLPDPVAPAPARSAADDESPT